jgi:hypothetical protein
LGVVGLGAVAITLLALSGTASAVTNTLDPNSARGQAATALAAAIQAAGGYEGSEASLVVAYEQAAGLSVDAGYPGTQVMSSLQSDLAAMGTSSSYPLVGTLTQYPWTAAAGWTSGNVPAAFVNNSAAWTAGTTVGT